MLKSFIQCLFFSVYILITLWEEKGNLLFPKNITQTSRAGVKPGNLDAKPLTTRVQSGCLAVIKELTKVACVTGI